LFLYNRDLMPTTRLGAGVLCRVLVGCIVGLDLGTARVASQQGRGGAAEILTAADVASVITAAASALSDTTMAVAVVDRAGTILGVYARPGAAAATPDIAVSLARTTAYFSNDQAPLSSRTVRFISGIHLPAGVKNTNNAALYGVENINRGCQLNAGDTLYRLVGPPIDRPRSIAGTIGVNVSPLPCRPDDTRGCARGGPILGPSNQPVPTGITTGKRDLRDSGNGTEDTVNPGGISLYRSGRLIGGVGVAGVSGDRAEFAALIAAAGTRGATNITAAINFPALLPTPGAVYIDGIRLPFYSTCGTDIACIEAASRGRPPGSAPGGFLPGGYIVPPRAGRQAPEGYLVGPAASSIASGLTAADVDRIVTQAVAEANEIRAQVRLPFGQTPSFIIAVTDENGEILAEYRMTDALFDAVDVVPSKARNAYYFSTPAGYQVLKSFVTSNPYDRYTWEPDPPSGAWALTSRTIGFGGQPLFPPGIDLEKGATPGPWYDLFVYDTLNPCTEGPGSSRGGNRGFPNQNGITWFPGSAPLYKNGRLVGGLGVSGDGVEQNDRVTSAGAAGFEPPAELRVDNSVIRTGAGEDVRLPYLKFPRNPTER
jgi:uncharacterized protein GlcG (DUF336 family)